MDDLLILGSDRKPSPWPRRLAVVAVLVAVAAVVITHLPGKREAPSRHPAVSVSVSAGPVQLAGLGSGAAGLLDQADGITRPTWPATSSSPASGRRQRPSGRHNTGRCPDHAVMPAGNGASSAATGSYCSAGSVQ
jgi:hypothetical protein